MLYSDKSSMTAKKNSSSEPYTFIDLFAGIGGFHIAFNNVGAKCVFASEWNEPARQTYEANFKKMDPELFEKDNFVGDITKVDKNLIPDFDIITGGFPCQPFSQAGFKRGFADARGTLFFDIAEIIRVKQPQAFFLENVRGLYQHDEGKTFDTIKRILTDDLGYSLHHQIVKASDHGLPQHRPRLFMVGFRDTNVVFTPPAKRKLKFTMSDVMGGKVTSDPEGKIPRDVGFTLRVGGKASPITDRRNWDSYYVDGVPTRINSEQGKRMQGFPKGFKFPVSDTQAMKQLGNSVAVAAIQDYAQAIVDALDSAKK